MPGSLPARPSGLLLSKLGIVDWLGRYGVACREEAVHVDRRIAAFVLRLDIMVSQRD